MKLWGLTGGIGSGKSTASQMFRALGARVVDADAVYHDLVAPRGNAPSALASDINKAFPGVLRQDNTLNRPALGQLVFSDARARALLNNITHPVVAKAVQDQVATWSQEGVLHALYDVPLLFENGLDAGLDGVVVVWVPVALQLTRLMARDGISEEAARQRLAAQMPLDNKRERATWVIDNSGSREATAAQIGQLWALIQESPTKSTHST